VLLVRWGFLHNIMLNYISYDLYCYDQRMKRIRRHGTSPVDIVMPPKCMWYMYGVCVYVCMCMCARARTCPCVYVCMCVCAHACVCMCIYACIHVCIHVCTYVCIHTYCAYIPLLAYPESAFIVVIIIIVIIIITNDFSHPNPYPQHLVSWRF